MNKKQFSKHNLGKIHTLWPIPMSVTWSPKPQPVPDEYNRWMAERFTDKGMIEFTNPQGYRLGVEPERVRQFIKPDRLVLRDQLIFDRRKIHVVPAPESSEGSTFSVRPPTAKPLPAQDSSTGWDGVFLFGLGLLVGAALAAE